MNYTRQLNFHIDKFLNNMELNLLDSLDLDKSAEPEIKKFKKETKNNLQVLLNKILGIQNMIQIDLINSLDFGTSSYLDKIKLSDDEQESEDEHSEKDFGVISDELICSLNGFNHISGLDMNTFNDNDSDDNGEDNDDDEISYYEHMINQSDEVNCFSLDSDNEQESDNNSDEENNNSDEENNNSDEENNNSDEENNNSKIIVYSTKNHSKNNKQLNEVGISRCLARIKLFKTKNKLNKLKISGNEDDIFEFNGYKYGKQCSKQALKGQDCCAIHNDKYLNGEISLVNEFPNELKHHPEFNNIYKCENNSDSEEEELDLKRINIHDKVYLVCNNTNKVFCLETREYLGTFDSSKNKIIS